MISKLIKVLQYAYENVTDLTLLLRYNTYSPFEDKHKRLFYRILITAHSVEKGLTLESPRTLFGRAKIHLLIQLVEKYDLAFSPIPVAMAAGAVDAYVRYHRSTGITDPFLDELDGFLMTVHKSISRTGGTRSPPMLDERASPLDFLKSRYSCRSFKQEKIDTEVVQAVVTAAQRMPSQCNRQSSRIHYYHSREAIQLLLNLQGGSVGFSHLVPNLFVVTSELTAWGGPGQRNQAYVDGSLFAMGTMLALHAMGIAMCPLNLAITNAREREIKKAAGIHPRERLIMMIAFGEPASNEVRAAASPRLKLDTVLHVH